MWWKREGRKRLVAETSKLEPKARVTNLNVTQRWIRPLLINVCLNCFVIISCSIELINKPSFFYNQPNFIESGKEVLKPELETGNK